MSITTVTIQISTLCVAIGLTQGLPVLAETADCFAKFPTGPVKIDRSAEDNLIGDVVGCLRSSEVATEKSCRDAIHEAQSDHRKYLVARCCGRVDPEWCKEIVFVYDAVARAGCLEALASADPGFGQDLEKRRLYRVATGWFSLRGVYRDRYVESVLQLPALRSTLYPWDVESVCAMHLGNARVLDLLEDVFKSQPESALEVCAEEAEVWLERDNWRDKLWSHCLDSVAFLQWACANERRRGVVSNAELWDVLGITNCEEVPPRKEWNTVHDRCKAWAEEAVDEMKTLWSERGDQAEQ